MKRLMELRPELSLAEMHIHADYEPDKRGQPTLEPSTPRLKLIKSPSAPQPGIKGRREPS